MKHPDWFPERRKGELPAGKTFPDGHQLVPVLFDGVYPCTIFQTGYKELCSLYRKPGWNHHVALLKITTAIHFIGFDFTVAKFMVFMILCNTSFLDANLTMQIHLEK